MAQSFTGVINTNGEWETVSSLTNITFAEGTTYNMQINNLAYLKIGDAVFSFNCEKFDYKAGTDDLYIKTNNNSCTLSILEAE